MHPCYSLCPSESKHLEAACSLPLVIVIPVNDHDVPWHSLPGEAPSGPRLSELPDQPTWKVRYESRYRISLMALASLIKGETISESMKNCWFVIGTTLRFWFSPPDLHRSPSQRNRSAENDHRKSRLCSRWSPPVVIKEPLLQNRPELVPHLGAECLVLGKCLKALLDQFRGHGG